MSKFKSIIFEGKPHHVVQVKVENKKHPPPPHKSDYPIPATPPGMKKRMEKRGDDKAVRAWLERQLKPYQSALAKWEKQWAEKPRFLHVITVDLLAQRWSGHFMGKPGGPKFSEADLIGSEILQDGALRLTNGKGIRGHVDHLAANEIRDNREILSARDGGVVHPVEAVPTSTVSKKRTIDYTKPKPTTAQWAIVETMMLGMMSKEPGISANAIRQAMPDKWAKHPDLKRARLPSEYTFRDVAREVILNKSIRRAHRKRDRIGI